MLNVLANTDLTMVFDLVEDDQFVSPDVGSVRLTVRNELGQPLDGYNSLVVSSTLGQTTFLVPLPQALNQKVKLFETRTVELRYTVDGRPGTTRKAYRIHDWMNFTVSADDVRLYMGVSHSELPDDLIDMVQAYFWAEEDLPTLDDHLTAGDLRSLRANRVIVLHAALDLAHTMQLRLMQRQSSETASMARFMNIDWNQISHKASAELSELNQKLSNSLPAGFPLFTVTAGADPITGG